MNDKSNILASLMGPKPGGENKENERGGTFNKNSTRGRSNDRSNQPTSGNHNHHHHHNHHNISQQQQQTGSSNNKQHRLKQRFTVIRKLGKGTYGKVQLAINKETGQEVAIKTIKKTKIENEQDLQRVRREIQIMSSIEHPHIIHIYEVFENKDKIVLVMQYAPGGELYEYVSQSKLLDDSEARRLFRQIATAIYYCHQNKICHRDLKLENILLDEKNNAKLADFGLSNVFDKSHQLKTFCGSPLYASPEIVQGSPYEGPEVDCWSLGVLLYTLVYGAMPFDGSNFKRLVKQISESCYFEPKQKSQASPLIRKLLCADPAGRATILDICSDPWVNGIPAPAFGGGDDEPHPSSPATSGHHQSLLKVAQDMANLTPVRFDILLALTPGSLAAAAAAAAAGVATEEATMTELGRPPLARPDPSQQLKQRLALNPSSIMELEEQDTRATSPVASYIVRDLLAPENGEQPEESEQPTTSTGDDKLDGHSLLESEIEDEGRLKAQVSDELMLVRDGSGCQNAMMSQEVEQTSTIKGDDQEQLVVDDNNYENPLIEANPDNMNDHSMHEDEPTANLLDIQQQQVEVEELDVDKADRVEAEAIGGEDLAETRQEDAKTGDDALPKVTADGDGEEEEVKMDVDPQQVHRLEPPVEAATSASELPVVPPLDSIAAAAAAGDDKNEIDGSKKNGSQVEVGNDQPEAIKVDECVPLGNEDKPKKVKKKIVVVKKRKKKVSSKEPDTEQDSKSKVDKDMMTDELSSKSRQQDTEVADTPTKVAGKMSKQAGPGKVRIPNTFQPQATPLPPTPEETPSRSEVRRQSSLVADVSHKLLQQSTSPTTNLNTVNLIRCDQPQLASVRVSDKKSEFERRASLAAANGPSTTGNGKPTVITPVLPPAPPELYQAQLLRERPMEGDNLEQMTIIEPVVKLEPFEVKPATPTSLRPPPKEDQDSDSESKTPTYQKEQATAVDIRQKLIESLDGEHQQDEQLPAVTGDRSDSVETIKADAAVNSSPVVLEEPKVRSQFSIQLGGNKTGPTESRVMVPDAARLETTSSGGARSLAATGPTPITRSYKKVTFTRDGACITETGRIYSRQADDGTVRRVERKSKITHYPAGDGSQLGAQTSGGHQVAAGRAEQVEEEEEEVYEEGDGGAVWQEHHHQFQNQQVGQRKTPLERLIMPTSVGADPFGQSLSRDFGDFPSASTTGVDHHQVRPPSFTGRERSHSRQLGRADSSCSSCSSGSTDVFDDIFDHWTGAISMFNQGHTMGGIGSHFRPFSGRFAGSLASGGRRTPGSGTGGGGGGGGSLAGTPRCESAEPGGQISGHLHNRRRKHRDWRSPGANTSGYESDAASERPATAMGGSGARGSLSRLFPSMGTGTGSASTRRSAHLDPFFEPDTISSDPFESHLESVDSLRRTIAQEHDSLRRRLAQQHRQLWKGSTPSLFSGLDEDPFASEQAILRPPQPPRAGHHRPSASGSSGQLLRSGAPSTASQQQDMDEAGRRPLSAGGFQRPPRLPPRSSGSSSSMNRHQSKHEATTATTTASHQQHEAQASWPRDTLEQSQSSSSFLRQSIALDLAPKRLSGHQQVPEDGVIDHSTPRHEFQQTMRRSTSKVSLLSGNQEDAKQQQQHSIKHQASFIELKRTSSSSSANKQLLREVTTTSQQQHKIQQESMGHATTMTTATTTTTTASTGKVISNRVISNSGSSNAFWETVATPTTPLSCATQSGPLGVENRTLARDNLDLRVQNWLQDSTGNMSTSSGSKSSVSATSSEQQQQLLNQYQLQQQLEASRSIISDASQPFNQGANTRQVTSRATFTLRQSVAPEVDGGVESHLVKQQQKQQVSSSSLSSSMSNVRRQATTATMASSTSQKSPIIAGGGGGGGGPLWTHESSSRSIFGEELDEMSLSGGESPSSSSLLDQLRSRGYRSMINQRMVAQQTPGIASDHHQPIEHQVSSSSTSQINRQEQASTSTSSSTSRVIISSSSTRVVKQQQNKQIVTSSSSACNQTKIVEQDEEQNGGEGTDAIADTTKDDKYQEGPLIQNEAESHREIGIADKEMVNTLHEGQVNQTNGNDQPSMEKEVDTDDEDVREAKASIKAQLDRVKETEMFLKSLHAEEAEAEQRRQQLFVFNNLMLNSKLNGGFKSRPLNDEIRMMNQMDSTTSSSSVTTAHFTGPRSAPVVYMAAAAAAPPSHSFGGSMGSPYEPAACKMTNGSGFTQKIKSYVQDDDRDLCFGSPSSGYASRKLQQQPLPNLSTNINWSPASYTTGNGFLDSSPQPSAHSNYNSPPIGSYYSTTCQADFGLGARSAMKDFRRSKSQLSDQFDGLPSRRGVSRPISANLDSLGWMSSCGNEDAAQGKSVYFPSRARRSFSQIRATHHQQSAPNRLLSQPRRPLTASVSVSDSKENNNANNIDDDDDEDEDHGLGSYRVSAYVPKVVPQGAPASRGRSCYGRSKGRSATSDWNISRSCRPTNMDTEGEQHEARRARRISLQENQNNNDDKNKLGTQDSSGFDHHVARKSSPARRTSSPNYRRRSLTSSLAADNDDVTSCSQTGSGERCSRLSELEQRLLENKRRREELLAGGRVSPPTRQAGGTENNDRKEKDFQTVNVKLNVRPSRLESMEARIKRKSFYVRTSPERSQMMKSQQSLEKWRRPSNSG